MSTSTKVWFITGASSGFCHALASYAIGRSYKVAELAEWEACGTGVKSDQQQVVQPWKA